MSPETSLETSPPADWMRPSPSVTYSVWPSAWQCHAVRAPGVKCTAFTRTRDGSSPRAIASIQTSPVNHSLGPLVDAVFRFFSIRLLLDSARRAKELLDLPGVEVLVRPADHAVAHVADEADVHLTDEAIVTRHVDRVLLQEAALEHPDAAVLEPNLGQRLHA